MSEYIFKLPDLGEGLVEAEIAEWMVKVGDIVQEEDPIGAMLTDKAAVELSAPVTGRVISLAGELGDMVAVGAPLIVFETSEEQKAIGDELPDIPVIQETVSEEPVTGAEVSDVEQVIQEAAESTQEAVDAFTGEPIQGETTPEVPPQP